MNTRIPPLQFSLAAQSQLHYLQQHYTKLARNSILRKAVNAVLGQRGSAAEAGASHRSPKSLRQRSVTGPSEESAKIIVIRK